MTNELKVGQTWITNANNLYRITGVDGDKVTVSRIGYVRKDGQEVRQYLPTEFCLNTSQFDGHAIIRPISQSAGKFDVYFDHCPTDFNDEMD